jgi:hypothetical protein
MIRHALGQVAIADPPGWLFKWLLQQDQKRRIVQSVTLRQFDGKVSAWARAAIDGELARLVDAGFGTRNHTLASVAFKLGALCGGGEADASELRSALYAIAEQWPDERMKSADTITRAFSEGTAHPRCVHPDHNLNDAIPGLTRQASPANMKTGLVQMANPFLPEPTKSTTNGPVLVASKKIDRIEVAARAPQNPRGW